MPPVKATNLEKPENPHQPNALENEDFTTTIFVFDIFLRNKFLKYLREVIKANKPINIKMYLSSRYSKHNQPNI